MRLTLRLAMTLIVLAHPARAAAAERCNDSHEVGTMSLRENMIGKARLNGEVVTGVLLNGLCTSGFVTRSGVTWIDWTPIDNIYRYEGDDVLILKIPRNDRFDVVTYEGDHHVAIGIFMTLGLLRGDCHHHAKFC